MRQRGGGMDSGAKSAMPTASGISLVFTALLCGALCACGFQLRGQATLPFDTLYLPSTGAVSTALKRNIVAGTNTRVVDNAKEAQAILNVLTESQEKSILSLNSAGRVREYQLSYRYRFRVVDAKGLEFLPASEIVLTREITFNDSLVLAKESEEALLYRDLQSDMVQQVLRRLATAKAPAPPAQ